MSFDATVTKEERVVVTWNGRTVVTLGGSRGARLAARLELAQDEEARQLLLARATGNFKRGNER